MPLNVNTGGSTWAPAQTVNVWKSTKTWVPVKKMKVWRGAGPGWVLAWVHPVIDADLTLSKEGVAIGETYNVVLTVPGKFPEGASVTFRRTGYTSAAVNPAEGATTATLTGTSNSAAGTYLWYADVTTKGGNTTFGPNSQSVATLSTTVSLTTPYTWALSAQSGAGGTVSAKPATYTITLGTPSVATKLSLQLSYKGGAWSEAKAWTPPSASQTHPVTFNTNGAWRARAVVTKTDGAILYSAEKAITCYKKNLTATVSPTAATVGQSVKLTAGYSGDNLTASSGRWQYYVSSWVDNWSTANPANWVPQSETDISWRWAETYPDASYIYSNEVDMTVRFSGITVNGGHCHDIQAGMNLAKSQGKALRLTGTFNLYTNVEIPASLKITATGAKFNCNRTMGAYSRPGDAHDPGKFVNGGSGGGYSRYGWFTFDGGTFDGNGEGCFTISHSPGFTIKNATFYRYCANQDYFSWGDGHAIEVNSSGGNDNGTGENGTFNVLISGCSFKGTDMGQRSWGNDEPMHFDWSWEGSGGASPWDGTMTHNLRVTGCYFHRYSETATVTGAGHNGYNSWAWRFAICAIGGHDPSGAAKDGMIQNTLDPHGGWNEASDTPDERHNHFKFDNNAIHGSAGYAGGSLKFDKGAIHAHRVRQVWVVDNDFYGCGPHQVSGWNSGDIPTYGAVARNTSNNGGAPNTFWVHNS